MSFVGGDIIEITCNHPTLGSYTFFPKSGEDSTYDHGGFRSDDDENGLAGNGQMIDKMNRKRWFFEAVIANDQNNNLEDEAINALAASPEPGDWTITHANGSVYGGKGKPVGDIQTNANAATFPLKVSGGGKMEKIV